MVLIKKRGIVLTAAFAAAALAVLIGFVIKYKTASDYYENQLGLVYEKSLNDLNDTVNNIETVLKKSMYASTAPQMSAIAAELLTSSETAKSALAALPSDGSELASVNRFLSQVGNYSQYLSEKVIKGETIEEEERENLQSLLSAAQTVRTGVNEIQSIYASGGFTEELQASLSGKLPENSLISSISETEQLIDDYPTLIYDGPYSDALLSGSSYLLDNSGQVSVEEARRQVVQMLELPAESIEYIGLEDGRIPSYCFTSGDYYVAISRQGGYLVYFRNSAQITDIKLTYDQAVDKAEQYISAKYSDSFQETYYYTDNGVCVINFASKNGATVCYADLIKVGVALDSGRIVMVESRGFLMHNRPRTIATPKYTIEQAQAILSDRLTVQGVSQALIPSGTGDEKHCYEFACTGLDGEDVLVYVNTNDLSEEDILFLLKTDGGTLVR